MVLIKPYDKFNKWNSLYRFKEKRSWANRPESNPTLYAEFQTATLYYNNLAVSKKFHEDITGQISLIRQNKLIFYFIQNFHGTIYYFQQNLWFERSEEAVFFKLGEFNR